MRRNPIRTALLAVLVVLAAGCGGSPDGVDVADGDGTAGDDTALTSLPVGSWLLEAGEGPDGPVDVPAGSRVTLVVEDDGDGLRVGGTAACNGYGGRLDLDGAAWATRELAWTEMGCDQAVMATESAYLAAFLAVDTWQREPRTLELTGPGGTVLAYTALAAAPTEELVGTTWRLDGLVEGVGDAASVRTTAADADEAVLLLEEEGRVRATTGCRVFEGQWTASGDRLLFPSFGQADDTNVDDQGIPTCAPDVVAQEDHVLSVLGDGFVPSVDGGTLTLTDGALGLVYRVADDEGCCDPLDEEPEGAEDGAEQECEVADYDGETAYGATIAEAVSALLARDLPEGVVAAPAPEPAPLVRVDLLRDGEVVGGLDLAEVADGWAPLSYDLCLPAG